MTVISKKNSPGLKTWLKGVLLTFAYMYPVKCTFIPFLNSRYFLALIFIFPLLGKSKFFQLDLNLKKGFRLTCLLAVFIALNTIAHFSLDFSLVSLPLTFFLTYCGFKGLEKLVGTFDTERLTFYITCAALIQMAVSVILYFIPSIEVFLTKVIYFDALAMDAMERTQGIRLHGLGVSYFASGVVHSCVLLLIAIHSERRRLFYLTSFFIISLVGLCISRTIMVGFVPAFIILIYKISKGNIFSIFMIASVLVAFFVVAYNMALNSDSIEILLLFNFGFDFINHYLVSGDTDSESITVLKESMQYPESIFGWIFGDGYFADPEHPDTGYYKNVDQGYLRAVFYYGIVGILIQFYSYWVMVVRIVKKHRDIFYISIFITYSIIFMKGYQNLYEFIIPLLCISTSTNKINKVI